MPGGCCAPTCPRRTRTGLCRRPSRSAPTPPSTATSAAWRPTRWTAPTSSSTARTSRSSSSSGCARPRSSTPSRRCWSRWSATWNSAAACCPRSSRPEGRRTQAFTQRGDRCKDPAGPTSRDQSLPPAASSRQPDPWRAMARPLLNDQPVDHTVIQDRAPTVAHLFRDRVAQSFDDEAFRFADGDTWRSVTWQAAAGLVALGVAPEDRVAVASTTRLEWVLSDLAVTLAGAATTTIYPTTSAPDVAFIVADSQSRVVIAEDDIQVAKLREHRDELPDVARVVTIDGTPDGDWVISLADLERLGRETLSRDPRVVDHRVEAITPDSLATVIYTSGTTGRPKGVRLRHSSWTYTVAAIDAMGILREDDLHYLWLPLAHVFGKMLLVLPLQIGFVTAVDGRVNRIVENMPDVQPTFMGAAPRIFEKAYGKITTMVAGEGGEKARLFSWAIGVGRQVAELRQRGEKPHGMLAARHAIADKLVLHKIRDRFGGRVRFFISGSAALDPEIARWFDAVGMPVLEGYGLSETSAASFVNRPGSYIPGTVGWPVPGTQVCIADDGEVLIKGPGVMQGYLNQPEATEEALDMGGWLHTGDIGSIDEHGFLRITDRKKDLFKTSQGKNVAPSAIEAMFKGICPYVSQFMVYGEGRHFVTALITLDYDAITEWGVAHGMAGKLYREMVTSPECRAMVQDHVDELNSRLNRWETIKNFIILPRDLSIEEGELT